MCERGEEKCALKLIKIFISQAYNRDCIFLGKRKQAVNETFLMAYELCTSSK